MDNPTTQELEQLLGQREHLLANIKTLRLAHSGQRLVLFHGSPLGIVQRPPGRMYWISPKRWAPFWSLADAAVDCVGWCWKAYELGGMPALRKQIAAAKAEAERLGAEIEAEDFEGLEV
jgi:hypothetical protein